MNSAQFSGNAGIVRFNRDFYSQTDEFTFIGDGEFGGKASGLAFIKEKILSHYRGLEHPFSPFTVTIPRLVVITTPFFDRFMDQNNLYEIALSDMSDERIAHHFLKAELPPDLSGDLRALIARVHEPLAIRSSSLLEDSVDSPFAGIYETKMIPNNQPDADTRFRKLADAIKFVYASTFFNSAKSYIKATPHDIKAEKMAVIIQEVLGQRHYDRFYPHFAGVARSYNFYPTGQAKPEEGVVNLALGLGKAIVDGGMSWAYSPAYPDISPPYGSVGELMKQTQIEFWAVNMGKPPAFDPAKETEYLVKAGLTEAEYDNTLTYLASTYDPGSDRVNIGVGSAGPRIITFAPILQVSMLPLNPLIQSILKLCEETFSARVETEFAVTIDPVQKTARFGFLQVRPMALSAVEVDLEESDFVPGSLLTSSESAMGNGCIEGIRDILYLVPETFNLKDSRAMAGEIAAVNRKLLDTHTPYLLIGFGRWGSSDPWLGIPVDWGHISGARVIVEAQLPNASFGIDLSQGSHFFHNLSNLGILYFSIPRTSPFPIDWEWLKKQELLDEGKFSRHVRLTSPLTVKVDGRNRQGVILK